MNQKMTMQTSIGAIEIDSDKLNATKEFLEHYGVPGMKWGVRKQRPTSGQPQKISKKQAKKLLRQKKAAKAQKEREAKKRAKILKNPTKLYRNRDKFSEAEIKKAMERFNWERNLRSFSKSDLDYGRDIANNILQTSSSLIGIYNNIARTYNSLGSPEAKWKYIENIPGGKDKKKDKNKDDD